MADPQTGNVGLYIPTRGSDSGTWDLPVNANSSALDAMFANVTTISLSNTNVTLSTPPNSGASWAGPYQAQSALIKLIGNISTPIIITIPRAGFYIFWNLCTDGGGLPAGGVIGTSYVVLQTNVGGHNVIGLPPGKKCHVFSDGVDMDFVNPADPGIAYDLHGATGLPSWMGACTVAPYLIKDGSVYNNSQFPTLAGMLGNQFGGTPGLSFAVPDERNRMRLPVDTQVGGIFSNRVTGSSGIPGQVMNSSGGEQTHTLVVGEMPSHNHTDSGHSHASAVGSGLVIDTSLGGGSSFGSGGFGTKALSTYSTSTGFANIQSTGGGATHQNMPPTIVSFLALIKT